jgi:hypothetical protein
MEQMAPNPMDNAIYSSTCELDDTRVEEMGADVRVKETGEHEDVLVSFCPVFLEAVLYPHTDVFFEIIHITVNSVEVSQCQKALIKVCVCTLCDIGGNSQ